MKEQGSKKRSKQIVCIIVAIMLCNFIVPSHTYAFDAGEGGSIFDPFIKFTTFLCDSVMQFMQNSFTSNQSIANGDGTYNFQYSPAIIFSGTVQGLDINFITPNTDVRNTNNYSAFIRVNQSEYDKAAVSKTKEEYEELEKLVKEEHPNCQMITGTGTRYKSLKYYNNIFL